MAPSRGVRDGAVGSTRLPCATPHGSAARMGFACPLLDVLSGIEELKICTAYELAGQSTRQFPSHVDDLRRVEPKYETLAGLAGRYYGSPVSAGAAVAAARNYLDRISELVGVPVELVSVGPDRRQTIRTGVS